MEVILLAIVWTLCFTMATSKISNLGLDKWWQLPLFFLMAPIINIVVLLGWGFSGYMSKDWENLM